MEYDEVAGWDEAQRSGLGVEFVAEIERATAGLRNTPALSPDALGRAVCPGAAIPILDLSGRHDPRGLRAAGFHRVAGGSQPKGRGKATTPDLRTPAKRRRAMCWAQRLKRVFGIEIEICEQCGGEVRVEAAHPGSDQLR